MGGWVEGPTRLYGYGCSDGQMYGLTDGLMADGWNPVSIGPPLDRQRNAIRMAFR